MSGGIQLSSDMVNDLKDTLIQHDASCQDDMIFLQYLAAISSYVLAHQKHPGMDKNAVLSDIGQFMAHVLQQVEADMAPQQPAEDAKNA